MVDQVSNGDAPTGILRIDPPIIMGSYLAQPDLDAALKLLHQIEQQIDDQKQVNNNSFNGKGHKYWRNKMFILTVGCIPAFVAFTIILICLLLLSNMGTTFNVLISLGCYGVFLGLGMFFAMKRTDQQMDSSLYIFHSQFCKKIKNLIQNDNRLRSLDQTLKLLILMETLSVVKKMLGDEEEKISSNKKQEKQAKIAISNCILQMIEGMQLDLVTVLSQILNEQDGIQLQKNVDLIFKMCIPLYMLIQFGGILTEEGRIIKTIILSDRYQSLIQKRISNGTSGILILEVFKSFVIDPQDIENFKKLTQIERMINAEVEFNQRCKMINEPDLENSCGRINSCGSLQLGEHLAIVVDEDFNSISKLIVNAVTVISDQRQPISSPVRHPKKIGDFSLVLEESLPMKWCGSPALLLSQSQSPCPPKLNQSFREEPFTVETVRVDQNELQPAKIESQLKQELLGSNPMFDSAFQDLYDLYYERDLNPWVPQVTEKDFIQHRTMPNEACPVVQIKVRTILKAPPQVAIDCGIDYDVRALWDEVLYDFRVFQNAKDRTYQKLAYTYKSPWPVSDRDFFLQSLVRYDQPEPGMISLHVTSLPQDDATYPVIEGRIRGTVNIIGFVFKLRINPETGAEETDYFMTNCIDVNGSVPKWMQNVTSGIVPKQWIKTFEKGCQRYTQLAKQVASNKV